MSIEEHVDTFAGWPVEDFDPEQGIEDPTGTIYRLRLTDDDADAGVSMTGLLARFLYDPAADRVPGLVIGAWTFRDRANEVSSSRIVEALVAARDSLPELKALFLGDI